MQQQDPAVPGGEPHRSEPSAPGLASQDGESLYSRLFDASPFPAVVSRLDNGTVLALNERTAQIMGVPRAEAVGASVLTYYVDPSERLLLAERLRRDGLADNLRLRIRRADGEPLWVLASSRLVTWRGEAAALTVFHDITDQLAAQASLKTSERRLVAQSDALTSLTARYTRPGDRFDERLQSILETAAHALQVERLSMWQFDPDRESIRCAGLYRRLRSEYDSGAVLHRSAAPAYFAALERERVVAARDAPNDPRTREFRDTYLRPLDIGAMLDVPLRHDNATVACSARSTWAGRGSGPWTSRTSPSRSPTSSSWPCSKRST